MSFNYNRKRLSGNPPRTVDFTNQTWGHAFHGSSMSSFEHPKYITRMVDKKKNRRRYTVCCHCTPSPDVNDLVKYKTASGVAMGKITGVHYFHDPRDMFCIEIVVEDNHEQRAAA